MSEGERIARIMSEDKRTSRPIVSGDKRTSRPIVSEDLSLKALSAIGTLISSFAPVSEDKRKSRIVSEDKRKSRPIIYIIYRVRR